MPLLVQTIDALWHSLCPAFETSLLRATRVAPLTSRPARPSSSSRALRLPACWTLGARSHGKRYATTAPVLPVDHDSLPPPSLRQPWLQRQSSTAILHNHGPAAEDGINARYADLRRASQKAQYQLTHDLVRQLVYDDGEAPNLRLYEALILCNASTYHGSIAEVEWLLEEMETEHIPPDSAVFHAILKVLAVHPDYLLRATTLAALESRWFPLTDDGWQYVVAGLIRERQLERAVAHLEKMEELHVRVPHWLYDVLTYVLCSNAFFAEALALTQRRVLADDDAISGELWHHILDTAARAFHHSATLYVWQRRVVQQYINPPLGMCVNVLDTAARAGDPRLAEDVLQTLRQRGVPLQLYHYEAVLDAYVHANRIAPVFAILAAMDQAGLAPAEASTRSLYLALRDSPAHTTEALDLLTTPIRGLPASQKIPSCALNAIIEAFVHQGSLDAAFDAYHSWPRLPVSTPTTATFNALMRGCSKAARKDLAMVVATEMLQHDVPPDSLTYDRLILTCLTASIADTPSPPPPLSSLPDTAPSSSSSPIPAASSPKLSEPSSDHPPSTTMQLELDDAWRYLDEMLGRGWWPRRGTVLLFVKRCVEAGDERLWGLVDEAAARGAPVANVPVWVERCWGKATARNL